LHAKAKFIFTPTNPEGRGPGVLSCAFPSPELSSVPIKPLKTGEFRKGTIPLVNPSQLIGKVTTPPGSGIPGDVPLIVPKMIYLRFLLEAPASREKLTSPPLAAEIATVSTVSEPSVSSFLSK